LIGTKWFFRKKLNEQGEVVRNKARTRYKGYSRMEGIDFEEIFSLVPSIEAIRLFLAYVGYKDFKFYQMDVSQVSIIKWLIRRIGIY
jgi:hypothetical protein